MRLNYARNTGRPWAVRILLDGTRPSAPRRAEALPRAEAPQPGPAPTRV